MPNFKILLGNLNIKSFMQLLAGILFIGLGIYILLAKFENNNILIGQKKILFGGILSLYGFVRLMRIFKNLKIQKQITNEDSIH